MTLAATIGLAAEQVTRRNNHPRRATHTRLPTHGGDLQYLPVQAGRP